MDVSETLIKGKRTPVQRAVVVIPSALAIISPIAARLHDINLATSRPNTIHGILGHHPDGRPQPVADGQLGLDLDHAIANTLLSLGSEACGADRRDIAALFRVGAQDTLGRVEAASAGLVLVEVERVVGVYLLRGDVSRFRRQCRHNVQAFLVDVRVALVGRRPVKGTGAKPVELHLVRPNILVERLEVVFVDEAVVPLLKRRRDEVANDARARDAEQHQGADNNVVPPRLLHVGVLEPGLLVLAAQPRALEAALDVGRRQPARRRHKVLRADAVGRVGARRGADDFAGLARAGKGPAAAVGRVAVGIGVGVGLGVGVVAVGDCGAYGGHGARGRVPVHCARLDEL